MLERENIMTTITIHNKTEIKAEGTRSHKGCKPVFCITTGEVFASVLDAAEKAGVTPGTMSYAITHSSQGTTCKGNRYCFISEVMAHLEEISQFINLREEKVAAYDALKAEENAIREAEEKYQHDLKVAEGRYSRCQELYDKAKEKFVSTEVKLQEAYAELCAIKERGVQLVF